MLEFSLSQIATATKGQLLGEDIKISSISTDSRTIQQDDFFVALQGPSFDAENYLQQVAERGAAGALVRHKMLDDFPCVKVADTRIGLARLATLWRESWHGKLVAITGSNGKTTVKEMLAAILSGAGEVLATRGNMNNEIGLPLTLARLQQQDYAVVELGANHAGEIDVLSRIAQPDVAILNNAGSAHLEGFGSKQGVAEAKLEIINGLSDEGIFIYNKDDAFASLWEQAAIEKNRLSFGLDPAADISSPANSMQLQWTDSGFINQFKVITPQGNMDVSIRLAGEHNRLNALAAIAAAQVLGVSNTAIVQGLNAMSAVPGRLQLRPGINGMRLLDDSYNANPDSVAMAINILSLAPGQRTLVLGDLAELGTESAALHSALGTMAANAGIDRLYTYGELSQWTSKAFGQGAQHFKQQQHLIDALLINISANDTLLVKGSRSAAMELVADALVEVKQAC